MFRKIINASLFIVMGFMLLGCGNNYSAEYDVGVIYTTEYKNKTEISFLNEKMQEKNRMRYRYSCMAYDGFSNSLILGNELYLLPKGHADKLDYGKVIAFNLKDGKIKEYDFNRTNITDFTCDSKVLYTTSNLNGKNYIDRYDMHTAKIETMELNDVLVNNLTIENDRIFGTMLDLETDQCFLCEFHLLENNYEVLYEIESEEEPTFMEIYHGNLYFPNEDILYEYNIQNKTLEEIKLPHKNAYNLKLVEDTLYIGCTDIFNGTESYVDIMYLPEKKVMKSIKYDGIILQMEVSKEDKLGILDYDKLSFYDISKEKPVAAESMEIETADGYYIGGFYLNENK